MKIPNWLPIEAIIEEQQKQINQHGGAHGIRDLGLLESALARAQNLYAYGQPDLADLAATLAFGIASNHAFVDGNKRTSFFTSVGFLHLNGHTIPTEDYSDTWVAIATGQITEQQLADWFREHIIPYP
jgi:death on curing protein